MMTTPPTNPTPRLEMAPRSEIFGRFPSEAEIQAGLARAAQARSEAFYAAFRSLSQFFVAGLALRVTLRLPPLSVRPVLNPC